MTLPPATVAVAKSSISGGPSGAGTPMATGLVDMRRSVPPNGATRRLPAEFTKCSEIWPAAAAISGQSPMRPRCPELRKAMIEIPLRDALSMPRRTARGPMVWPNP